MIEHHGLIVPELKDEHYTLGALRKPIVRENRDWRDCVPQGEQQDQLGYETYSCTCQAHNNAAEIFLKAVYNEDVNYSDRALAIAANIDPLAGGGDPHEAAEGIRKYLGAIPETSLPFDAPTVTEWYRPKPLTKALLKLGKSWLEKWSYGHEWLIHPEMNLTLRDKQERIFEALKYSPVPVSVYAWVEKAGKYVKPLGVQDTHYVVCVYAEKGKAWYVADSYAPFLKKLDWNYDFDMAQSIYVGKNEDRPSLWEQVINFAKSIIADLTPISIGAKPSDVRLSEWASAIQQHEGWYLPGTKGYPTGSVSYRNNNPGNLRYSPFQAGTRGGFSYFHTYSDGFAALIYQLRLVTDGRSPAYNAKAWKLGLKNCSELTLLQFYGIYAPAEDQNNPTSYASFIAAKLDVQPSTRVCDL